MRLGETDNGYFKSLNDYVLRIQSEIDASAAAICIMQKDTVIHEWYSGRHDHNETSRIVDAATQFNLGSIRKTYLGLAVSLLIERGMIGGVDDEIGTYLPEYVMEAVKGVTLRHLLTHTHGLVWHNGKLAREFPAGEGWAYRNCGIDMLNKLVRQLSGQTLSAFMQQEAFDPFGLAETGWRTSEHEHYIYNYYRDKETWVGPNDSGAGDQSNLFASARDLAKWGNIHLRKGRDGGRRLMPESVFARIITPHTPDTVPARLPRNGFMWWLQSDTPLNQIGERLPAGSYQVLGITGCACLVIPSCDAVVVRMYNQLSNAGGYDYLADIRTFGNKAYDGLSTYLASIME